MRDSWPASSRWLGGRARPGRMGWVTGGRRQRPVRRQGPSARRTCPGRRNPRRSCRPPGACGRFRPGARRPTRQTTGHPGDGSPRHAPWHCAVPAPWFRARSGRQSRPTCPGRPLGHCGRETARHAPAAVPRRYRGSARCSARPAAPPVPDSGAGNARQVRERTSWRR
ncbi:hypothetical protein FQZ97_1034280 [compost metagenome]